ncbi:DsrE family protein [Hydrogenimonas cancrithermarum]|uniref:Intracellular sulfur oxidation protein, DsrE/DsrF family n=1 Tax=Hydrogenimonas cancrithermarum TaxID=2993563 RepID=A0ABM8FMU8_9BACT|nr:DsrE family protein [Hydrogenimonas cancrithermarum]BDY13728.1 hypothetical protein HCR_20400 [Hydrogenimonas cancrithermarum]
MKHIVIFLMTIILSAGFVEADEASVHRVVFDVTTGDVATFEKKILSGIVAHYDHYQGKLEELRSVVVIHGGAYRFFLKNLKNSPYADDTNLSKVHTDLGKRLGSLHENYGVEFRVCSIGLKKRKIDTQNLYPFIQPVFSSLTELIERQNAGFAYIPVP